eukprot:g3346.t1
MVKQRVESPVQSSLGAASSINGSAAQASRISFHVPKLEPLPDPVPEEDPANPNNWLSWGALEGKHGDDPVTPSVTWSGDYKQFFRDVKPPLFDQFYVIVVPDDDKCFKGYVHNNVGATASHSASYSKLMFAFIGLIASLYLY